MTREEPGALRAASIRERNERLVLRLIFRNGPLSQSRAASLTGLKPPTVFRIFSELERSGLIVADSGRRRQAPEKKGRRPLDYRVVPDAAYTVGVDFWIGSAAVIIQDFSAHCVYSRIVSLADTLDAQSALQTVHDLIAEAIDAAGIDLSRIIGIGVGAPGSINTETGAIHYYSRIRGMNDFPLGARLEASFKVPVTVNNNATVVAIAEHRYGPASGSRSVFVFLMRAGVGGAYLQDGLAISDHGRTAFEVGHLSMDGAGPLCSCGNRGCLETYLSEDAILKAVSAVADCPDLAALEALLHAGDEHAESAIEAFAQIAARAVRDIRRLLAPETIVLVTRSPSLSRILAQAASSDLVRDDERFGPRDSRIFGAAYDPILACKAACDLAYDTYFAQEREMQHEPR